MADKCVVRNVAYSRAKVGNMERHNERKNERYGNGDVQLDRAALNVHFKGCEGGYLQAFDRLIEDGTISTRGLKKDAKVIDEMIFDVNTEYFERGGGYEYAKSFFEEAYRMAVKEAGGEEYVLSAVMHADERNKALSEQLGCDVYHYHLHVVYIPVVEKEVLWTKRCKDPALVGTVKEVIKQVSNSKKWKSEKVMGENGKERLVYSYSLLQDRYYEHMQAAGFTDFERGERGSTAEHLDVLEYKNKQEEKRAAALGKDVEKKEAQLGKLDEKIAVKTKAAATVAEVEAMGKPALLGGFSVSADEMKTLKTLAKKSVKADEKVADMKRRMTAAESERDALKTQVEAEKKARPSIRQNLSWFDKFTAAMKRAPKRLMAVIEDILRQPPEKQEPERSAPERKRSQGLDI
ncbi:plasmid recombination protein [Enterococcus faecalis]|uniref:plasmid recombination protein n=1 Tax=Enterococcus faecalis TaxID=1351 RepID=UPI0008A20404|nr:plasmid recombination protein [Enterococcus faecalis]OGX76163.1 recombinase [Enterococcus faecalis]